MTTFRALLIGADHYFPNRLPNGGTYRSLRGAVNDSRRVEAMLRARIAGPLEIRALRASSEDGRKEPPEPCKEWPTYENITRELRGLEERAERDDQIFIHYAGHGGRVPTRFAEQKGRGTVDETLVPIDIGEASTRHVRDVDLAWLLDRLAAKGAVVTLVLDSCHSAGATRAAPVEEEGEAVAVRSATGGSDTIDTTERPAGGVATDKELGEAWQRLTRSKPVTRSARQAESFLPDARGYVLLAACAAHESAIEIGRGRTRAGVLTEALLEALGSLSPRETWKSLYDRVYSRVRGRTGVQTPQLLGEVGRAVLGVELRPVVYTMTVEEVDPGERRVRIGGGWVTGLTKGASVAVYAPGTTDFASRPRVAVARVVEVEETSAWAEVEGDVFAVELGAAVILTDMGAVALRRRVRLAEAAPGSAAAAAMSAVRAEIEARGSGFLALCGPREEPHYQVDVDDTGRYGIADAAGSPFEHLGRVLVAAEPGAAATLVERLLHLAQYHRTLAIESPPSAFAEKVTVELWRVPKDYHLQKGPPPGGELLDQVESVVPSGARLLLRVVNRTRAPVYVAAFDLQDDWAVAPFVPDGSTDAQYETADEDQPWVLDMDVPPGRAAMRDTFKVFVSASPARLRFLEMRAMGKRDTTRSTDAGGGDWLTRQFRVLVQR